MIGYQLVLRQQKTARTRILEYLREPFGGAWLGEPGFMTVAQIADGSDVSPRHARKILAALAAKGQVRTGQTKPITYAALGGLSDE